MRLGLEKLRGRLKALFRENFEKLGELGAAVSVWENGKQAVDLCGGFCDANREKPWTSDTIVLVWSAAKGIGSASLLHVLQQHKIELDRRVAEFWPEFAQAGKDKIKPVSALWTSESMCSITMESFERWRRKHRCGYPERRMVITRARSDFYWTNSSAVSPARLCPVIGRKILRVHSTSTFGSACPKRRIREWQRLTLRKGASRPSQQNSIAILSRPARWREGRLPRHMA
jgi:hypothetical protein